MRGELLQIYSVRSLNYGSRGFELSHDEDQGMIGVRYFGMAISDRVFQGKIAGIFGKGDA